MSYEEDRAELLAARETIARLTIPVTEEAAARGETWRAKVWFMGSSRVDHYLTPEEAREAMDGDRWVEWLHAPDGTLLDQDTLEPLASGVVL